MTEDDLDRNRRHFLTVATLVTGAVGAGAAMIPFISSLKPSARAQALGETMRLLVRLESEDVTAMSRQRFFPVEIEPRQDGLQFLRERDIAVKADAFANRR